MEWLWGGVCTLAGVLMGCAVRPKLDALLRRPAADHAVRAFAARPSESTGRNSVAEREDVAVSTAAPALSNEAPSRSNAPAPEPRSPPAPRRDRSDDGRPGSDDRVRTHTPNQGGETMSTPQPASIPRDGSAQRLSQPEVSRFLAEMIHEIRTPLSSVMGMTELTLDTSLSNEQKENLEAVLDAAGALMDILNDAMDYTRFNGPGVALKTQDFSPIEVAAKVVKSFEGHAKRRETTLELEIDPDTPEKAGGDPARLAQALRICLAGVLKYAIGAKVVVKLKNLSFPGGPPTCIFAVADNVAKLPKDAAERLARLFGPVDHIPPDPASTRGMSLFVARRIIELMGGEIAFEHVPGQGSTLSFTARFDHARDPFQSRSVQPAAAPAAASKPLAILFAEDNKTNQIFIADFLRQAGHEVRTVNNGLEAVEALERERFDLVLMDIQMPEMDGVRAASVIRKSSAGKNFSQIPIIALTAYAVPGDEEKFLRHGMNGYVAKPVDRRELYDTIDRVMRPAGQA